MRRTIVIPDTQIRKGVPIKHMRWLGRWIADEQPDTVVMLGDWIDNPAISKYSHAGRSYQADVDVGINAMHDMLEAISAHSAGYKARFVFCVGNHEHRLVKYLAEHPELDGALHDPLHDFEAFGWEVIPFLMPVTIGGVRYCHYFPRSARGNVMQDRNGAPDARAQAVREMTSCVAGHQQGFSYYEHPLADQVVQSMIAGSCYLHEEAYLTHQGTQYWRGAILQTFHRPGEYDFARLSLRTLKDRYA